MRLAFITSSFPPHISGVAVNAVTVTSGMAKLGHQVAVFIPNYPQSPIDKSSLKIPNLSIFRLSTVGNPFISSHLVLSPFSTSLFNHLTDFKPDVIHLQEPNIFLFPIIKKYADKYHIPIVCAHHFPPEFVTNQFPYWLRNKVIKRMIVKITLHLYRQATLVITPTHAMEKLLKDHGSKTKISVISNGVDTLRFSPGKKTPTISTPILLYLGRMDFDKNLDTLIQAAKYIKSNYEIWLVGSGKAIDSLKSLTDKLNLNEHIKFLGYLPEEKKVDLYRQATVFINPSTAEAQSIVSLEAAACNIPLILANATALPELIDPENPCGVLFTPNDPLDLATKIDLLLSNPKLLTKMRENTQLLADKHNLKNVIAQYEQTYLELCR